MEDLAHQTGTDRFSGVDGDHGAPSIRMFKKVVASLDAGNAETGLSSRGDDPAAG